MNGVTLITLRGLGDDLAGMSADSCLRDINTSYQESYMAISLSELIKQNTLGQSEAFPDGVPHSYSWYQGWNPGGQLTPPADFTAVEGWGQVYTEEGAPASPNADVQVANAKTYVHIKETGQWVLVQDQSKLGLGGGHFVEDFAGNSAYPMQVTNLNGTASFDAPVDGYNDHFWYGARGTYTAGTVDGVYVQMDMRTTDPNAQLVAMVGVDWWRSATAPFLADHSNNPGVGGSNWVELSTQWKTIGYYSMSTAAFTADLPPPLLGSSETPPVVPADTLAPAAPSITAFTPDTGTVGDKTTDAKQLTLSGTAEAGSTVKVFEGATVIGAAQANASGAWSLTTAQLAVGTHAFTATATDAAGNVSTKSAALSVIVSAPVVTPPPTNSTNLLVNGSFEATTLAAFADGRWGAYDSVSGWTALSGGKIELWNNLGGIKASDGGNFGELDYAGARDGFYQDVKTDAGKVYNLSFDARSRPGFTGSTCSIEVLWNGSVIATVPPGAAWETYDFKVVGTGGRDRLTFRELASQGSDGLGALYDNIELSAAASQSVTQPPTAGTNLLTNGSFESSSMVPLLDGRWGAFNSVSGWHAISGGTIELWNNLNGVKASDGGNYGELDYAGALDGLYQDVKTTAGQEYVLSLDARSRPGFTSSTCSIEVLWNDSVIGVVPPGNNWQSYDFSVVGTGGQDRLTIREVAGQSKDGLGALYDNISLVAKPTSTASASMLSVVNQAVALMTQYAAADVTNTGAETSRVVTSDPNSSAVQTLALPAQH
ncbi:Ig-like domain-containing protein [Bradyrhizobium sp. CCBAU 45389]|uniref:Ig-like domain-containing protein n=1 Tax=Bradyrhizobium sp. CCBAU 45389 TaxID=858429 RepID=UPI0023063567|nr:Ig-like domain-containing protein [Bradyrhizobium sp. CCBAU 45389]